jgi:hypothetical protein
LERNGAHFFSHNSFYLFNWILPRHACSLLLSFPQNIHDFKKLPAKMAEIELAMLSTIVSQKSAGERSAGSRPRSTQHFKIEGTRTQELPSTTDSSSSGPDDTSISYEYLEFETLLPSPTGIALSKSDGGPPAPEPPDLRPFTSPFEWSETRKTLMVWLSCISTVVAAYSAGSYASATAQCTKEWGVSDVAFNVGITTFTTGFGVAPMVLAPLSEINGRRPVFIATGVLFVCKGDTRKL